jgi:uracil-DNA glycosylase
MQETKTEAWAQPITRREADERRAEAHASPHPSGLNRKQRRKVEREIRTLDKKLKKLKEQIDGV